MNRLRQKIIFFILICFFSLSIGGALLYAEENGEAGKPGLDYEASVVEVIVPPDLEKEPEEEKTNPQKDANPIGQQINAQPAKTNIPPLLAAPQKNKKKSKPKASSKDKKQKKVNKDSSQEAYDTSESEKYIFISKPDKYNDPDIDFSKEDKPSQKTKIPKAEPIKWIHNNFMNVPKLKNREDPNDQKTKKSKFIRCKKGCNPTPNSKYVNERSIPMGTEISNDYKCWEDADACTPGVILYVFNLDEI